MKDCEALVLNVRFPGDTAILSQYIILKGTTGLKAYVFIRGISVSIDRRN